MVIKKKRLHIICGVCGSDDSLSYEIISRFICDLEGNERDGVGISCSNCSTVTGLDEVLQEKSK